MFVGSTPIDVPDFRLWRYCMDDYAQFLDRKRFRIADAGKTVANDVLHPRAFEYQRDITKWALRKGRAAVFVDTGRGKTLIELDWARNAADRSLYVAPLAVAKQTVREAAKFGIDATYARCEEEAPAHGITACNFEMMQHFDPNKWGAVVFDESSRIKSFSSKTRNQCIEFARPIPFRLPASATPAPNDFMELGNHAELLGVMSRTEMLSMFFVHDGGSTSEWRLKGHAEEEFFKWLGTWAVTMRMPSDFGYDDGAFILPPMHIHHHMIETPQTSNDSLFSGEALTLTDQRRSKRSSLQMRVETLAELANSTNEPWVIWCELNDEGDALENAISESVQVAGSDTLEQKESRMLGFADGSIRVLISKSSICGFGMNWQHCANVGHVGITHSWEQWKQANARCWRFGQTRPVNVHMVYADTEAPIMRNLERKGKDADRMMDAMIRQMQSGHELVSTRRETVDYSPRLQMALPDFLTGAGR